MKNIKKIKWKLFQKFSDIISMLAYRKIITFKRSIFIIANVMIFLSNDKTELDKTEKIINKVVKIIE